MRLGFAVAIHVDPDVLLVDEVLAVGDEGFTHKCLDKFAEFRRRGKTILLVTHSLGLVERFCDEARLARRRPTKQAEGDPKRVIGAYLTAVEEGEEHAAGGDDRERRRSARTQPPDGRWSGARRIRRPDMFTATEGRWGSREIEITEVTLLDRERPAVVRLSLRRADVDPPEGARRSSGRRFRVRRRPVQRRRGVLLRHQHVSRRDDARARSRATRR